MTGKIIYIGSDVQPGLKLTAWPLPSSAKKNKINFRESKSFWVSLFRKQHSRPNLAPAPPIARENRDTREAIPALPDPGEEISDHNKKNPGKN
jgi:hypothetical protein